MNNFQLPSIITAGLHAEDKLDLGYLTGLSSVVVTLLALLRLSLGARELTRLTVIRLLRLGVPARRRRSSGRCGRAGVAALLRLE